MISPDLQQQIIAYGNNLHISQKGLFHKAVAYPRWKKRLLRSLLSPEKLLEEQELEELLGLFEQVQEIGQKENGLLDFIEFLRMTILSPFVFVLSLPFYADIVRAKMTWHSVDMDLLMEAMVLGSMVDT